MTKELEVLGRLLRDPARPFVVVLGGLKVSDKISLIRHMLTIADTVLIGGAMANAFLAAKGSRSARPRAPATRSRSRARSSRRPARRTAS